MPTSNIDRKLIRPVDARGLRGIFSRGKAVYKGGSNTPNTKKRNLAYQQAALERLRGKRSN